ncbi:MAG: type II toxin-antitoxin system HicB family antitoxin [Tannerella sp.]|jgi:predicted HicB family RNase H-like nuclease|nr:type II toxin-antitoxin system HicB family antitoxin [Tannerella sp.]
MGYLKYKGYKGSVEFSEEDNCLFGQVVGMSKNRITYEGKTIDELKTDFEGAIDYYLDYCQRKGIVPHKAHSGVLNIRISSEIHDMAASYADKCGITLNAFIREALKQHIEQIHT